MSHDPEEQDIHDLIFNQQVVCKGRLITQKKDFDENSYRILEDSLSILIIEDLISGSWTIEELSQKYGIHKSDIWNILLGVIKDPFVLESGYIPRRTGRDEREGHRTKARYSLIPIPMNARIFDPTLGFSLLGWSEFLNDADHSHFIPKTDEISDTYCKIISSFWEMPPEKIEAKLEKQDFQYLSTVYGPLPILETDEIYSSIKKRISENPDLLKRRFLRRKLDKDFEMFSQYTRQGMGTIPELQYYVVHLHDILAYCKLNGKKIEHDRFSKINRILFSLICNIQCHTEPTKIDEAHDETTYSIINELQIELNENSPGRSKRTHHQERELAKIKQSLASPVLYERVLAVRQIRKGIVPPDIPILTEALKDNNSSVQMESIKAIRECYIAFPPLNLYHISINSKDKRVQYAAIDYISSIFSPEALETLELIALNGQSDSAKRALSGIAKNQPKTAMPILRNIMVNTNDSQVRVAALKQIDVKEYREIIPLVIKCLDDSQLSVRTASVSTLAPIGTTEICDALKKRYSVEISKTLQKLLLKEIVKIDPDFCSKDLNQKVNRPYGQQNLVFQVKPEERHSHKHETAISEREKAEICDNILERTYSSLSKDLISEDICNRQEAIQYLQEHFCSIFFPLLKDGLDNDPSVQHTTLSVIRKHNLSIPAKWYLPAINSRSIIIFETIGILAQIKIDGGPDLLKNIIIRYHDIYAKPAILALSSYPEKESVPILKEFLGSQNMVIRSCSAEALGNMKVDSAYDALIEGISDNRDSVRLSCIEALPNIQYHYIIEILQDRYNNDPSKQIRKVASEKLASMYQDTSPLNNGYDLKGLKNKHFRTRIATINQFADRKDSSVIEPIIQILENDGSPNVRMSALNYLVNFEDKRILNSIMASFLVNVPRLQIAMVPIIAQRGEEEGLRFLAEQIDNLNSQVRTEICYAFQNYGDSSHNRVLEHLVLDPSKNVATAARKAIDEIQIRECKTSMGNNSNTQDYSQSCLLKTDEPQVNPSDLQINVPHISEREILNGLQSKSPKTRITTIQQLWTVKNPTIIKSLIQILKNDRYIEVQIAALKCLENIEDPQIVDSIIASFENSYSELRVAMVPVIAQKGGDKGLKFLTGHLNDRNFQVRTEICHAFGNHGNSIHNHILEQLILDPSKDVSNAAKIAIKKIQIRERKTTHDYSTTTHDISKSEIKKTDNWKVNSSDFQINVPHISEREILNGLQSKSPKTRITTIQQLGTVENPTIKEILIKILENDRFIEVQIAALKCLENIIDPQIVDNIMASFEKSFSELRVVMVPVIAQKGGDKGLKFLAGHLNDRNSQVRTEICHAFGNYGNSSHNHILEQLILDPSKDVSNAAKIAIQEIGLRESRANLPEISKSPTLKKFAGIHIESKIGTSHNLSKMNLEIKKDVSNTTKSSIHVIKTSKSQTNSNDDIISPSLKKFSTIHLGPKINNSQNSADISSEEKKDSKIPPTQNAKKRTPILGYNLGRLELEVLQSDLRNRQNKDEQMNSAYELGISKDIRAPPLLIEALDEKNPSVLYEVLTALGELGDPSACPHLRCFLNSDEKLLREAAADSIEKIGCPNFEEKNRISEEPNPVHKEDVGNDCCKISE